MVKDSQEFMYLYNSVMREIHINYITTWDLNYRPETSLYLYIGLN